MRPCPRDDFEDLSEILSEASIPADGQLHEVQVPLSAIARMATSFERKPKQARTQTAVEKLTDRFKEAKDLDTSLDVESVLGHRCHALGSVIIVKRSMRNPTGVEGFVLLDSASGNDSVCLVESVLTKLDKGVGDEITLVPKKHVIDGRRNIWF